MHAHSVAEFAKAKLECNLFNQIWSAELMDNYVVGLSRHWRDGVSTFSLF